MEQISLDVIHEISLKPIHARKLDQLVANVDREQGGAHAHHGRFEYQQNTAHARVQGRGSTAAAEAAAPVGAGSRLPLPLLPGPSLSSGASAFWASSEAPESRSQSASGSSKRGGRHAPTVGAPKRRVKECGTAPTEASTTETHGAAALPSKCPDTPSTALRKAASSVDLAADDDGSGVGKARSNSGASIDSGSTSSVSSDLGHSSGCSHSSGYSDGSESDGPLDYNAAPHRPPPSAHVHDSNASKLPRGSSLDDMVSASRSESSSTQRRGSGNSSNSSSSLSKTHSSALYDRNGVSMGSSGRGMPRSRSDPMTSARDSQNSSTTSDAPRSNSTDAHVGLSLDGPDTEKRGSSSAGSTAVDMHSVANVSSTMPSRKDRPGRPSPTSVTSHHLSLDDHEDEALLVKAKETSTAPSDVGDKALLLREEALVELNKDDDDDALLVEHKADDVEDVARRRSESNANSGEKVLMPISDKSETEDAACLDADEVETAEAPDVVGGVSTAGDVSLKGKTEEEDGGGDLLSPGTAAATATSLSTLVPPPPPPQPYCLPPKSEWPDFPVLLRMSPDAKARVWVNGKKVLFFFFA